MNRNLIIGIIALAVMAVGAAFLLKSAPSQTTVPSTEIRITTQPTEAIESEATGSAMSPEVKNITVTASNFKFDTKEISVKKNDKVKLTLKSIGGFHNFVIDELTLKTPLVENGKEEVVEFTADKAGTFDFYCSVGNHREMGMVGKFTVE